MIVAKTKQVFRVSTYRNRGTELVFDREFTGQAIAFRDFQKEAARYIRDPGTCVLLSVALGNNRYVTLAAKSTDSDRVVLDPAFYGREA